MVDYLISPEISGGISAAQSTNVSRGMGSSAAWLVAAKTTGALTPAS